MLVLLKLQSRCAVKLDMEVAKLFAFGTYLNHFFDGHVENLMESRVSSLFPRFTVRPSHLS